ncbi:hypothetical protein EX30DRAFT_289930, partial [Ascodesmis nigricans]
FVDNVGICGPKTRYNDEEVPVLPGVRRFILQHICNVEIALFDIEQANGRISGEKSEWGSSGISIVGYVCDENGRFRQESKVRKIECWPECKTVKEVR